MNKEDLKIGIMIETEWSVKQKVVYISDAGFATEFVCQISDKGLMGNFYSFKELNDFSIAPKEITITESQFDELVEKYINGGAFPTSYAPHSEISKLKKELGF